MPSIFVKFVTASLIHSGECTIQHPMEFLLDFDADDHPVIPARSSGGDIWIEFDQISSPEPYGPLSSAMMTLTSGSSLLEVDCRSGDCSIVFAERVGRVMYVPKSMNRPAIFVAGPFDPFQYCISPIISYDVPLLDSRSSKTGNAVIPVTARFPDGTVVEDVSFLIMNRSVLRDMIPRKISLSVTKSLLQFPRVHSIQRVTRGSTTSYLNVFSNCDRDILENFPTIEFDFIEPRGTETVRVVFHPEDYLKFPEDGKCTFHLYSMFMKKVGVILDYESDHVSFCLAADSQVVLM